MLDPHAREQRKLLKKKANPMTSFIWRFLACCFVLDACVWGYFTFIEKVPVFVGLQKMREGILENREKQAVNQIAKTDLRQKEIKVPQDAETGKQKTEDQNAGMVDNKHKGALYSWTNKEGKRSFSNIGFPEDRNYTEGKIELNR